MKINVMRSIAAMLLACAMSSSGRAEQRGGTIESLVEAEKAFAAMASEKGFRDSFLANFTEEGIAFTPGPGRSNEALRKLPPPPPGSPKRKLKWRPDFSDISAAGDLGYNTGPFWTEGPDGKDIPQNQGYFFSIWRWQPDNTWKVVLDIGAPSPMPQEQRQSPWKRAVSKGYRASGSEKAEVHASALRNWESEAKPWSLKEYEARLASESRYHGDRVPPVLGAAKVVQQLRNRGQLAITFKAMFVDVADSLDLGYTYGSYDLLREDGTEKGYYTHVWKRNPQGSWQLAAEIRSPAPLEARKP
jgi:ketosteroid isomerase-like protein